MSENDSQHILTQEILEDAKRQAERARKKGEREAAEIRAEAEKQAQAAREQILEHARRRAERERQMILATLPLQVKRHRLELQESLIQEVFKGVRNELALLDAPSYFRAVTNLGAAAILGMVGNSFTVTVGARGHNVDVAAIGDEIVRIVSERSGRRIVLECRADDSLPLGVQVQSKDGRQFWDNTFEARMERLRSALRREIASILFGEARPVDRK